ncbi:MAG: hypothetical protein ABIQ18_02860 [Umezawaea sp.]
MEAAAGPGGHVRGALGECPQAVGPPDARDVRSSPDQDLVVYRAEALALLGSPAATSCEQA